MAADDISRLYTFTAGTTAVAAQVNGELNQVITTMNNKAGRGVDNTMSGDNTFTGDNSFTGANTFSDATAPIKTDKVLENSSDNGVDIDGVLLKDGYANIAVSATPATPADGDIWVNTTANTVNAYVNSATVELITDAPGIEKGYFQGAVPEYTNSSTITINAGLILRNSADSADFDITSNITVSLGTSGAGGLDNGSEANSTWYYVYLIGSSTAATANSAVFSTVNESNTGSITLPSGFDVKHQLPLAVRNDSSGNIVPFWIQQWAPYQTVVMFDVNFPGHSNYTSVNAPTNVVAGGTATSSTAVTASAYVPTGIAKRALLRAQNLDSSGPDTLYIVDNVNSTTQSFANDQARVQEIKCWVELDGSSQFNYYATATPDVDIDVMGFMVTEI